MLIRLQRLLGLNRYSEKYEYNQAIASYIVIFGGILSISFSSFLDPQFDIREFWAMLSIAIVLILIVLLLLLLSGRLVPTRRGVLALATVAGVGYYWMTGEVSEPGIMAGMLFLVTTALLSNQWGVLIATALVVGKEILAYITAVPGGSGISTVLALGTFELFIGFLLFVLANGWQQGLRTYAIEAAERRARLNELTTDVMRNIFKRLDLETLLDETVGLIRDRFDEIYHAQVFLMDEAHQVAILKASTGEAGRQLLARKHSLAVGSQSVIGQVTLHGVPVVALSGEGSVHRHNELLPNTQTELALPLISGDQVIGALDVQSETAHAFTDDDISVLQALANQIAIAIDNATLFAEQQTTLEENQRLAENARTQVTQIQDLNRRLTRMAWGQHLERYNEIPALTIDFEQDIARPEARWTPGMQAAIEASDNTLPASDTPTLAVPLTVRGQAVGAMEFELEDGVELEVEQVTLLQEIASRLSLSLESNRLFEEAQRLAQREAIVNEFGAQLQAVSGIENVLATAAQGLQEVLGAPRVAIRLGTPPANGSDHSAGEEPA